MARSHGILKTTVWDVGSEFRALTRNAQWAYVMLISQPQITNCGCLPYAPHKWARLAHEGTREQLDQALAELAAKRFIVVDETTHELLVRTFIKHDRIYRQPNLVKNARNEFRAIESPVIRQYLSTRHPWLVDNTVIAHEYEDQTPSQTPQETPQETPNRRTIPPAGTRTRDPRTAPTPSPSPLGDGTGKGDAAPANTASGAGAATPTSTRPTCPHCGITVMPPTTLADHLHNVHDIDPEPTRAYVPPPGIGDDEPEPVVSLTQGGTV